MVIINHTILGDGLTYFDFVLIPIIINQIYFIKNLISFILFPIFVYLVLCKINFKFFHILGVNRLVWLP